MKRISTLMAAVSLLSLLAVPGTFAQPRMGRGSGGWGMGSQYQRLYNPNTIETITGEVVGIETISPMSGMSGGVHLRVRTQDRQEISVHLGPAWYLDNQEVQLQVKNQVQVRGSRVVIAGQPALIAAEVRKGSQILTLRDNNGFPVWSGWRRQQIGSGPSSVK